MKNQPQRNTNKNYKPISSDFYDELEAAAVTNQRSEIIYTDDNGNEALVIAQVKDLFTEHGAEYVRLDSRQIIRLDQITSVNGRTETTANTSNDQIDIDRVERDRVSPDVRPDTTLQGTMSAGDDTISRTPDYDTNRLETERTGDIKRDETGFDNTGDRSLPQEDKLGAYQGELDRIEAARGTGNAENVRRDQDLYDRLNPHDTVDMDTDATVVPPINEVPADVQAGKPDLGHQFATSTEPFAIAENRFYRLLADRLRNRLYLITLQPWQGVEIVPELTSHLANIARYMAPPFTLVNDLTNLRPDENGTLIAPDVPGKDALLSAGLIKVADLVPEDCETLIHGIHSFSVNSVRIRYFKDRVQAENWLTGDDVVSTDMRNDRA